MQIAVLGGSFERAGRQHLVHVDGARLADAEGAVGRLVLDGGVPPAIEVEDVVRRAGLGALRRMGGEVSAVEMQDFEDALEDSRATVTAKMEAEYRKMRGELKKRAVEANPIGFFSPDVLEPTRAKKHD